MKINGHLIPLLHELLHVRHDLYPSPIKNHVIYFLNTRSHLRCWCPSRLHPMQPIEHSFLLSSCSTFYSPTENFYNYIILEDSLCPLFHPQLQLFRCKIFVPILFATIFSLISYPHCEKDFTWPSSSWTKSLVVFSSTYTHKLILQHNTIYLSILFKF